MATPEKTPRSWTTVHRTALALGLVATAMSLAASKPAHAQGCPGAAVRPDRASTDVLGSATLCLLNHERTTRGRKAVRPNRRLALAAGRHALDMVERGYFSHRSPSGVDFVARIKRTGYTRSARAWWLGENLAWGSHDMGTPKSIVRAWMKSPGHRTNVLRRQFDEIGLGIVSGAPEGGAGDAATYVTKFGTRR